MHSDRFKELLDELDGNSLQTLKEKNARYAKNGDCLHNFRSGAEIMGGSPAQACWGYMTKHLTALRDKVEANDFSDREDFLEKCQDTINYIRFLWCIGNDNTEETTEVILKDAFGRPVVTLFSNQDDDTDDSWCRYAFNTREEMDEFQNGMKSLLREHGYVTVEDAYRLVGMHTDSSRSMRYGWINLDDMSGNFIHDYEVYFAELPAVVKLSNVPIKRKDPCKYETTAHPYGDLVCLGTKEKDLCPGYDKCDRYEPKEETN